MKRFLFILITVTAQLAVTRAAEQFVTFERTDGALPLQAVTISYSDQEYEGVVMAIRTQNSKLKPPSSSAPSVKTKRSTS